MPASPTQGLSGDQDTRFMEGVCPMGELRGLRRNGQLQHGDEARGAASPVDIDVYVIVPADPFDLDEILDVVPPLLERPEHGAKVDLLAAFVAADPVRFTGREGGNYENVVAGTAAQDVATGSSVQDVAALPTEEEIITSAAVEPIVAMATIESILACTALHKIIAVPAA